MIHVIATFDLHPGTRAAFLAEFHKLMPLVHAEAGCIEYGPAIDIPSGAAAQPPLREDGVTIIEKWADLPALHAHSQAPHMAEWRPRVKEYVKSVVLHVMQPA